MSEGELTPEQQALLEKWQKRAQENQARYGIVANPEEEEKAAKEGRVTKAQEQANEVMSRQIKEMEERKR